MFLNGNKGNNKQRETKKTFVPRQLGSGLDVGYGILFPGGELKEKPYPS